MSGNNYVDLFVTVSPDEMIGKFKATAPPRVQEAMQRTVLRCIGSMRDFLVEDTHKTTGRWDDTRQAGSGARLMLGGVVWWWCPQACCSRTCCTRLR